MDKKFEIIKSKFFSFEEIKLINTQTKEYITILPQLGARLNEACINKGNNQISILQKLVSSDLSLRDNLFNNAKLFPFANRLEGGTFSFNGENYSLEKNYPEENNACHGFIFDKNFTLYNYKIEQDFIEITFSYNYNADIKGYPFKFKIFIIYRLTETGKIICATKVQNLSEQKMPFTDGWHHYFTLGESIDNLLLEIEVDSFMELTGSGIPNGKKSLVEETKINLKEKFFDTIFYCKPKSKITTKLSDLKNSTTLKIKQENSENKYKFLNIYTPPNRKTIAIEPMTSNINAFNNKDGLITLEPNKNWEAKIEIWVE